MGNNYQPGQPNATGRGWAYLGVALGAGVSIAANVAHSYVPPAHASAGWTPHAGAVLGAVFWPVALLVAIEILARVPWPADLRWVLARFGGLVPVAAVAAVVSWRHMRGLLRFYGEDGLTSFLGPFAVDGLMVMATAALLATRTLLDHTQAAADVSLPADPVPAAARGLAGTGSTNRPDIEQDKTPDIRAGTRTRTATPDMHPAVKLAAEHPGMAKADIARELGVDVRTVRRHLNARSNGHAKTGASA